MEVNVLLVEGQTDRAVFETLIEKIYGFRKEKVEIEGLGKTGLNLTYVTFRKDNTVIVLINAQDKYRMKDVIKNVLSWANFHKVKLHRIGLLRDIDTNLDIIGWAKSSLRQFSPTVKGTSLWINDTEIIPFGLGNVDIENPVIKKRKELELLLTLLAEKESTLSRFQRSLNQLKEDTGRRLKPKDIMHVLAIAKEYDGDSMSGLYRKLIEDIPRRNPEVIDEFLKETGLREFLDKITG
ncbi:DUF3226 domain-containing protein [Pyrococcus kukulkanii]|uniref:DUF3226 domain-containing protein n=1 Tax=Pyrococcus kukulkanii TaxID=1609559 RepID=UPI0035684C7A